MSSLGHSALLTVCGALVCLPRIQTSQPAQNAVLSLRYEISTSACSAVAVSPDGRVLACGDRAVELRRTEDGSLLCALPLEKSGPIHVTCLAFSPDGRSLVFADYDRWLLECWEINAQREAKPAWKREIAGVTCMSATRDGQTIALGTTTGRLALFSSDGRRLGDWPGHRTDDIRAVHYVENGTRLLTAGMDRTVRLWAGKELRQHERQFERGVLSVAVDRDRGLFAMATADSKPIQIRRIRDLELVHEFQSTSYSPFCLCFSPDGKVLFSGGMDMTGQPDQAGLLNRGSMSAWDVASGRELRSFCGPNQVCAMAIVPSKRFLVAVGYPEKLIAWELAR